MWEGEHYTIKRTLYLIKVFIGAIVVLIDRLITNIYWQVNWGSKTLKTISQTRWTFLRELRSCKIANISVNVIGKQFLTMASKMIHINNNLSTIIRRYIPHKHSIATLDQCYKIHGYDLQTLSNTIFHFRLKEISSACK